MIFILTLLLWALFGVAAYLHIYSDSIPEQQYNLLTLIAAPLLVVIGVSCIYELNKKFGKPEFESRDGLVHFAYLITVILGVLFLFMRYLPNQAQLAYSFVLGLGVFTCTYVVLKSVFAITSAGYRPIEDWIFRFVWMVFIIVIGVAYFTGRLINPVEAVAIILFGSLSLYFTLYTMTMLSTGHYLVMESHWGGLGAGLGGWRMSRPLVFLILALFFGAATVVLVLKADYGPVPGTDPEPKNGDTTQTNDKNQKVNKQKVDKKQQQKDNKQGPSGKDKKTPENKKG